MLLDFAMAAMDPTLERIFVGIAHALFMNRLHVLRLTEIVRDEIRPDGEDGAMELPPGMDEELRQQALDYVLMCLPEELAPAVHHAKRDWFRPA